MTQTTMSNIRFRQLRKNKQNEKINVQTFKICGENVSQTGSVSV